MYFDIFGSGGTWKIKTIKGAKDLSSTNGSMPGKLSFQKKSNESEEVELEYLGKEVISPFGKKYSAGTPYIFGFKILYLAQNWDLKLYSFEKQTDPLKHQDDFYRLLKSSVPIKETKVSGLNNSYWNGSRGEKLPTSKIATTATATINIPKGKYVLGVSAGDMVRVYRGNKLIIDARDPSKIINDADYHHDKLVALSGSHTIRVEQAQYGSYGLLYFTFKPEVKNNY